MPIVALTVDGFWWGWMGNDSVFFKGLATERLSQAPMSIWVTQIGLGGFGGQGRVQVLGETGSKCDQGTFDEFPK